MNEKREEILQPLRSFRIYLSERKRDLQRQLNKCGDGKTTAKLDMMFRIDDRFSDCLDAVIRILNSWEQN